MSHIIHAHSSETTNGNPKLPQTSRIEYGEIAVNYAQGHETISIKNSNDEIVTFPNENVVQNKVDEIERITASALNDLEERKANTNDLATVATTGSYNDLTNKPTLPTIPTNVSSFTNDAGYFADVEIDTTSNEINFLDTDGETVLKTIDTTDIFDPDDYYTKDEIDDGDETIASALNDLEKRKVNTSDLATVATSGSYNDLSNKPTIPAAQVQSDWNQTTSSEVDYIKNKPTNISSFTNDDGYYNNASADLTNLNLDLKFDGTTLNSVNLTQLLLKYGVEYIAGTQTASTNAFTGVTKSTALFDGKTIAYYLPYAGTSTAATLNLTLPDGTTSGAIGIQYNGTSDLTTQYGAGSIIILTYKSYQNKWRRCDYNTNTTYSVITNSAINTGTATTGRTVSAKVLHDAYNINGQVITIANKTLTVPTTTDTVTQNSTAAITSGGVYTALNAIGPVNTITENETKAVTSGAVYQAIVDNELVFASALNTLYQRISELEARIETLEQGV